jgi:hypothetical protein
MTLPQILVVIFVAISVGEASMICRTSLSSAFEFVLRFFTSRVKCLFAAFAVGVTDPCRSRAGTDCTP